MKEELYHSAINCQSLGLEISHISNLPNMTLKNFLKEEDPDLSQENKISQPGSGSSHQAFKESKIEYPNQRIKAFRKNTDSETTFGKKTKDSILILPYPDYILSKTLIGKNAIMLEIRDGHYPFLYFVFKSREYDIDRQIMIQFELKNSIQQYSIQSLKYFKVDRNLEKVYKAYNLFEAH